MPFINIMLVERKTNIVVILPIVNFLLATYYFKFELFYLAFNLRCFFKNVI